MPELVSLLPFVAIALIFWLLIVRPASRRQKEAARLQSGLGAGDKVMLSSGIYGVVTATTDDRVHVQVADGVVLEVARGAVASVDRSAVEDDTRPVDGTDGATGSTGTNGTTGTTGTTDGEV